MFFIKILINISRWFAGAVKEMVLRLIRLYQATFSPDHGWFSFYYPRGCCRFYPTCSEYGYQAIQKKGLFKGILLAVGRVLRCNPWGRGGYDPIK